MDQIIHELDRVRRTGRLLLIAQRLLQWLTAAILAAIFCGLLDYTLRLPGWLRLAVGVALATIALGWLAGRLRHAARFNPPLGILALRAERLYPPLAGALASSVEFAAEAPRWSGSPTSLALAQASIQRTMNLVGTTAGGSVRRLLDARLTIAQLAAAAAAMALAAVIVLTVPHHAALALERWFNPLGSAKWPKRTQIVSGVTQEVWPGDTPVLLTASVERGHKPGLRATVFYRILRPGQDSSPPWQWALMSEQGAGKGQYERMIDLADTGASAPLLDSHIEFYFAAGDDQTPPRSLRLIARPTLTAIRAVVTPPNYALGIRRKESISLDDKAGPEATLSALVGSTIRLEMELNKPVPAGALTLETLAPGLAEVVDAQLHPRLDALPPRIDLAFRLNRSFRTTIELTDEHGLSSQSQRVYAFDAIEDRPPSVSLIEPAGDESVLPTAVIDVSALAQDDVGVSSLRLKPREVRNVPKPSRASSGGRYVDHPGPRMTYETRLELEKWELAPGDQLVLTAEARDNFDLDGVRHEPVESAPRTLRIIDATTFLSQIRGELAGLRQQAVRVGENQRRLQGLEPAVAGPQQRQLTGHVASQAELLQRLERRIERNRLDESDGGVKELIRRAAPLVDQARQASAEAEQNLESSQREEARQRQERVAEVMTALVTLLDQGRDALALEMQLHQIATQQSQLIAQTRQVMPRTLGMPRDELSPEDAQALRNLQDQQQALSEQSRNLLQQMQATADALSRQNPRDAQEQATAAALSEAASIAQRQGLPQKMGQASSDIGQNQMSQAGQQQEQSLSIMREMLRKLQEQEQRRQEILHRQLAQLREAIDKLIQQQQREIELLGKAGEGELAGLEPGQSRLRRNTQGVEEMARAARPPVGGPPGQGVVADLLLSASSSMADAVLALRTSQRPAAEAGQGKALALLIEARDKVNEQARQNEEQMMRRQRAELRGEYEKLVKRQEELIDQAAQAAGQVERGGEEQSRQRRIRIISLGHSEEDLRLAAQELGRKVSASGGGPVFEHMHEQVDQSAQRATRRLHAAQADAQALDPMRAVARMLREMSEALDPDARRSEFAGQGATGSGGGGGGSPPLIPPVAELKLLRAAQEAIYQSTRALHDQPVADEAERKRDLLRLSASQRELAGVGERLIEKMKQP